MKPPKPWLTTDRLALREFTLADASDILHLDSDPRVMKYINGGKPSTPEEVAATMRRVTRNYALYPGLGTWRVERGGAGGKGGSKVGGASAVKGSGSFIGWCSLKYIPRTPDIEVGYRFVHDAWGHGYATECALAMVRYGFVTLTLDRIIGVTDPGNLASQHVLQKAGLASRGWGRYYGLRLRVFANERDAWIATH